MTLHNCFTPERLAAIRRAIASEVMLCAPVTIVMLAAAITLSELGTPTITMETEPLPMTEPPQRRITGTLS